MVSYATACILFVNVRYIGMDYQYHTTGVERDDCLLLECGIIEEFLTRFIVFSVGGLCSEAVALKAGGIVLSIALY